MGIKISIPNLEILDSGVIITVHNHPLIFEISGLVYTFNFTNNKDISGYKVEVKQIGERKGIEFNLINFDNSPDIGNPKIAQIGQIGGKNLYLNYRVRSLDAEEAGKSFFYTFYLEK